jgi:quercetin dioxygenase-like cupin family protein
MTTDRSATQDAAPTTREAPEIGYAWAPNAGEDYAPRDGDGLVFRDLGLAAASDGALGVTRFRCADAEAVAQWRTLDADFDFIYVLRGSVRVTGADAQERTLEAGGAAIHPRGHRYRLDRCSPDFEAVQITAPATFRTTFGDAGSEEAAPATYTHDVDAYVQGDGPRSYFRYRDLGCRAATDDAIHVHVVAATEPGPGTGWHFHTMAQWFMVIGGSAVIRVEDRPRQPLAWGDAMCVGRGPQMRHDVSHFSGDYRVLEMCVPAVYDTIAVDAPDGADAA